MSKLN